MFRRALLPIPLAAVLLALGACGSSSNNNSSSNLSAQDQLTTATPIKHLVVVFGENRSFELQESLRDGIEALAVERRGPEAGKGGKVPTGSLRVRDIDRVCDELQLEMRKSA